MPPGTLLRGNPDCAAGGGSSRVQSRPGPRGGSDGDRQPAAAGTLYVVATPIGNLEDITLRALRILREVDVVAAEDTRRTGNLLRHYQIATPLTSLHEHNEHQKRTSLVDRLRSGESVAVVSDAGTPGISDPGALLVGAARAAGLRVDPIPGPSAVTAVLSASGLQLERFAFGGFPPVRSKDRKLWLAWMESLPDTPIVLFEAPHRIRKTLAELRSYLVDRPITGARELTKAHEEWFTEDVVPQERGEFVIIVGQKTENSPFDVGEKDNHGDRAAITIPSDAEIRAMFGEMTYISPYSSRRDAIKAVADRLGLTSRAVYAALERTKT